MHKFTGHLGFSSFVTTGAGDAGYALSPSDSSNGGPNVIRKRSSKSARAQPAPGDNTTVDPAPLTRLIAPGDKSRHALFVEREFPVTASEPQVKQARPIEYFVGEIRAIKNKQISQAEKMQKLDRLLQQPDFPIEALYPWSRACFYVKPKISIRDLNDKIRQAIPELKDSQYLLSCVLKITKQKRSRVKERLGRIVIVLKEDKKTIAEITLLLETYRSIDKNERGNEDTVMELRLLTDVLGDADFIRGRSQEELAILANQVTSIGLKTQYIYTPLREILDEYRRLYVGENYSLREALDRMIQVSRPSLTNNAKGTLAGEIGREAKTITDEDLHFYFSLIHQMEDPTLQAYRLGRIAKNKFINKEQLFKLEIEIRRLSHLRFDEETFWKEYALNLAKVIGDNRYAREEDNIQLQTTKIKQTILEFLTLPWNNWDDFKFALSLLLINRKHTPSFAREKFDIVTKLLSKSKPPLNQSKADRRQSLILLDLVPDEWYNQWAPLVVMNPATITEQIEADGRVYPFYTVWEHFITIITKHSAQSTP